jgi:hypothetical protein
MRAMPYSGVRRWNQLAVATNFRLRRSNHVPFDLSAIRSIGSRRRRFGLKPPSEFDVPPDHVLGSRHRRLEGALITKVSQRCHPPAALLVAVTTIAPWGTRSSLRQSRSCAAEEVEKRPMSQKSLKRKRKQGGAFILQRSWQTAGRG